MNTQQIIIKYLDDNELDGLCNDDLECGCSKFDLAPCGDDISSCVPARLEKNITVNGEFYDEYFSSVKI